MTKKRTNQDAIKDANAMAYVAGDSAAKEAINAMADADGFNESASILANCFEEIRTCANASASLGAAKRITAVMFLSKRGCYPPEHAKLLGEEIASELLSNLAGPATTVEQAAAYAVEAADELMNSPHHRYALNGFVTFIGPRLCALLEELHTAGGTTK
jgi:hypothetical protein